MQIKGVKWPDSEENCWADKKWYYFYKVTFYKKMLAWFKVGLISKCLYSDFNFFQKMNQTKSTWGFIVVKSNWFVRFFEKRLEKIILTHTRTVSNFVSPNLKLNKLYCHSGHESEVKRFNPRTRAHANIFELFCAFDS